MATYPVPAVGQRLTAEFVTSMLPQTARKPADTSRASTTTRTADPDLTLPVEANATYALEGCLFYSGLTVQMSILWSFPAGAAGRVGYAARSTVSTGNVDDVMQTADLNANFNTNTTAGAFLTPMIFSGTFTTAGTAGTLALTWAQVASSATALNMLLNSWMKLTRIG